MAGEDSADVCKHQWTGAKSGAAGIARGGLSSHAGNPVGLHTPRSSRKQVMSVDDRMMDRWMNDWITAVHTSMNG
jgi:hypothetical protein